MKQQVTVIRPNWEPVRDEAKLDDADQRLLWRQQFLNDLAFDDFEDRLADLVRDLSSARAP